jgi:hypothetical protein
MREIIEYKNWERPIYFAVTCADDNYIGLQDYLRLEGLAEQFIPQKRSTNKNFINEEILRRKTDIFVFDWQKSDNNNLDEFRKMLYNCRYTFLKLALLQLDEGKEDLAIKTLDQMESKIPNKLIPMGLVEMYETAFTYLKAGAHEKYDKFTRDIERLALEKIANEQSDLSSYYDPYRILIDLYEEQGRDDKLLEIWKEIRTMYPNDPSVKANIEKYKKRLSGKKLKYN